MSIKSTVINVGFNAFRATRMHRLLAPLTRGRGAILTFHHVRCWRPADPGFAPNRLLEIEPGFLDETLSTARALGFEIVSLTEAVRRLDEPVGSPFLALTFDDGARDVSQFALPILEHHQAPFTMFVATGFAERTARMWWLELERAIANLDAIDVAVGSDRLFLRARSTEEKRAAWDKLYWMLRDGPEERLLAVTARLAEDAGVDGVALVDETCMAWREIIALSEHPLATIGAHSITHRMLAKWPEAVARDEMAASRARIEKRIGRPVRHFAYPVGDATSAGPREFELAAALGFVSAVTTRPGMLFDGHRAHKTALPRISINGLWQRPGMVDVLLSGAPFALWNGGRRINAT
jgi:peptidoglycan/xylan/chitin deacetylase (PgdA/CDA1 family)